VRASHVFSTLKEIAQMWVNIHSKPRHGLKAGREEEEKGRKGEREKE
jgi:hypothetical protein